MTVAERLMTAQDLWRMPRDETRRELVKGELRTMSSAGFNHGTVGMRLAARLTRFVEEHDLGSVAGPDTGFVLRRDPDTVRAPDVSFVSRERVQRAGRTVKFFPGAPDLAVEVVSPSDTLYEVEEKVHDLLDAGTKLVWVVNPKQRTVSVYRPGPVAEILSAAQELDGEGVVPGFRCAVAELFR